MTFRGVLSLVCLAPLASALQSPAFHHLQGGDVNGVHFLDDTHGFAAEDGGRIRFTVDGGASWNFAQFASGVDVRGDLRGFNFTTHSQTSATIGFCVGDNGVVLRSDDIGLTWSKLPATVYDINALPAALYATWFFDESHGFVVGLDAAIAYTDDGGSSWHVFVNEPNPLGCLFGHGDPDAYDIQFVGSEGWIAAEYGIVVRANSNGTLVDCTSVPPVCPASQGPCPTNLELWAIDFSDANNGYVVGGMGTNSGFVYATSDGGDNWVQETCFDLDAPPTSQCESSPGGEGCDDQNPVPTLYGLGRLASGELVTAGYGQSVLESKSGGGIGQCSFQSCTGAAWDQAYATSPIANPPLISVAATSTTLWIGGTFNVLRKRSIGTWTDVAGTQYFRINDGVFRSSTEGYMVGQALSIHRTTDSGSSFRRVHFGPGQCSRFLHGIAFDGTKGIAVGDAASGAAVVTSSDGGGTWSQQNDIAGSASMYDVAFDSSGSNVMACGGAGHLRYASTASWPALTWSSQTITDDSSNPVEMRALTWVGTTAAVVVGFVETGTPLNKTAIARAALTPGGTWSGVGVHLTNGSTPSIELRDVRTRGNYVVAVGGESRVFVLDITNIGAGFLELQNPYSGATANALNGVALAPGSTGDLFAVGDGGLVVHFDLATATWSSPKSTTTFDLYAPTFFSDTSGFVVGRRFGLIGWN